MAADLVLRQRLCRCGTTFYICRSCDRGHRYCSERCRLKARREQRREANRRHQQSLEGRLDHRDRQRLYRQRLRSRKKSVTDQGSLDRNPSDTIGRDKAVFQEGQIDGLGSNQVFCIRCGRAGYPITPVIEVNMEETAKALPFQQEYVRTVLHSYVDLPETPARYHALDRRIALELFQRQVPVEVVEAAFLLGSSRRLARDSDRALPPIRCLAYFLPVVEEVLAQPPPPDYVQYLRLRLKHLALIRH
jgi:hypothetical protein